jgi:cobalamin biosynthesis protein CbiD
MIGDHDQRERRALVALYAVAELRAEARIRDMIASCSTIEQALDALDADARDHPEWINQGLAEAVQVRRGRSASSCRSCSAHSACSATLLAPAWRWACRW